MIITGVHKYVGWTSQLGRECLKEFGLSYRDIDLDINVYLPKLGKPRKYEFGHAYSDEGLIELAWSNTEETDEHRWLVIHEVAHCIDRHLNGPAKRTEGKWVGSGAAKTLHRGKRIIHGKDFSDIAIPLYQQHKVVRAALKGEYGMVKKAMLQAGVSARDDKGVAA